jgi:hypothetical protein
VVDVEQICNKNCRDTATTMTINADGTATVHDPTETNSYLQTITVAFQDIPGYYGSISCSTSGGKVFAVDFETEDGPKAKYGLGKNM